MFKIKDIKVGTFESDYQDNIQLQFNSDTKFTALLKYLSQLGIDYQQTLANLCKLYDLSNADLLNNQYVLNSIGYALNLPPLSAFSNITPEQYLLVIKGQLAKNQWDGTNKGMTDILNSLFPQFQFVLQDIGTMQIKISLIPLVTIDDVTKDLFKSGYFTPKPIGVDVELEIADEILFSWDNNYVAGPPQLGAWDNSVW